MTEKHKPGEIAKQSGQYPLSGRAVEKLTRKERLLRENHFRRHLNLVRLTESLIKRNTNHVIDLPS